MYTSLALRKLKTDWAAITNINTLVPGNIQEGLNTQTGNPYARCEVTVEREGYKSDQARYSIFAVLVEIFADSPTPATLLTLEQTLQTLLTSLKTGTLGGGVGEATGAVVYAWERQPGSRSLQTAEERRAGQSVGAVRMAVQWRVDWS